MFARYAFKVAELAAQTVVWVREPLAELFTTALSQVRIHTGKSITGKFDYPARY